MIAHAYKHPHLQPDQAREHPPAGMAGAMHTHTGHGDHAAMVAHFRRRFWLCLALTPLVSAVVADDPARVGAGLMWASTLIVAINAQLLRFYRKKV